MKKQIKGISLIVLVITIVIIIILAAAIILTINKNNPIENTKRAVFMSDLKNYQEKLILEIATRMPYDKVEEIKTLSPSQTDELLKTSNSWKLKLQVSDYNLKLVDGEFSDDEKKIAKELGILTDYAYIPLDGITMETEPKIGIDQYTNVDAVTITLLNIPSEIQAKPEYKIIYNDSVSDIASLNMVTNSQTKVNSEWIPYVGPFKVSKRCTIQVRVEENKDTIMFSIENIDRLNPNKLYLLGNDSFQKEAVVHLLSQDSKNSEYIASGIKEIKYKWLPTNTLLKLDDFTMSTMNDTNISVPDGNNYLHTMVVDNAGNYEIEVSSNSYKIDNVAPDIGSMSISEITSSSVKATINDAKDLSSGIKDYDFYIDGVLKATQSSDVYVYTGLIANQTYDLTYKVRDNIGNETNISPGVSVIPTTTDYVKNGLMLWYDGIYNASENTHNNSSPTWYDLSGNGNNGTAFNCTWENNAIVMNGSNSWVRIKVMNYSKITLQVVYMLNSLGYDNDAISNFESGGYGLSNYSTSYWKFMVNISDIGYVNIPKSSDIVPNVTVNKKYLLSGSYDGSTLKYMQNEQIISQSVSGSIKNSSDNTVLALGTNPSGSSSSISYLNGRIFSVRVYNRALSDDELKQNYEIDKQRFGL